jgi:hypothetical protein
MDGFMHQKKPVDDLSLNMQPLMWIPGNDKKNKQSSFHKIVHIVRNLRLVPTTIMFFAVDIGPFVVQPEAKAPSSSPTGASSAGLSTGTTSTESSSAGTTSTGSSPAGHNIALDFVN